MSLDYKVYQGLCPDLKCQTRLVFPAEKSEIECPNCGQVHCQEDVSTLEKVTDEKEAVEQILKSIVWDVKLPKKTTDTVKVNGLSNYHCKLISPFLTKYGMDKAGNPKLLKDLGHGDTANCGKILSKRSFSISPGHMDVTGYGKDQTGSEDYLKGLLENVNEEEEVLVPIHADGDGHCLVHALSRATTGREIFWHALSQNLMNHVDVNQDKYEKQFKDFIDEEEWPAIIAEADPGYVSSDGFHTGLRNIHIFALANVLRRPIILLDVLENVENVADYTGIFLPVFEDWVDCKDHPPLCIAWSGAAHNHFIPLVGVEGRPRPRIPARYVPKVWGVGEIKARPYLTYNDDGSITIPAGNQLKEKYIQRLLEAIDKVFLEKNGVSAELVSDMHLHVFQRVNVPGLKPEIAISKTREALEKKFLFRCLWCNALTRLNIEEESLSRDGFYHKVMIDCHGKPDPNKMYSFPIEELQCKYDQEKDRLVPYNFPCSWCKNQQMRQVDRFGKFIYQNGDPTQTQALLPSSCCGFKHFWDGKEYENIPKMLELNITVGGKVIHEQIPWFYGDSGTDANSDLEVVSRQVAIKHFGKNVNGLHDPTAKIRSALQATLRDLNLTFTESFTISTDDLDETEKTFSRKHEERPKVPNKIQTQPPTVDPTTSKRPLLKRQVNGTMKPPSPILQRENDKEKVIQENSAEKIIPAKQSTNPLQIKVRFWTSDGRDRTIEIADNLEYSGLIELVSTEFEVPRSMLVLKTGVPPRPLRPTAAGQKVLLRNGDKVTVEIHKEKRKTETNLKINGVSLHRMQEERPPETTKLRNALANILPRPGVNVNGPRNSPTLSNLDISLQAVTKMAQITKRSVWEYAIHHPELFRREGVFYNLFRRDIGLVHGQHCQLPHLPERVFRYNGELGSDRVELCLEPVLGHFPITPEITKTLEKYATMAKQQRTNGAAALNHQSSSNLDPNQKISEVAIPVDSLDRAKEQEGPEIEIRIERKNPAPGFVLIGKEPTPVSQDEAEKSRETLLEKLSKE